MKKRILILPILAVAVIIRFYFLIKINEPVFSVAFLFNLTSILIFWIFLQSIFNMRLQILLITLFLSLSPWHILLLKEGSRLNLMIVILLLAFFPLIKIYQKSRILFTSILFFTLIILSPLNILTAVSNTVYHTDMVFVVEEQRREHVDDNFTSSLLHNKLTNYLYHALVNYSQHFSLQVLFLEGNIIPEVGLMYLFDFLLLSVGLIYMIKEGRRLGWIIIWILLSPLVSSLDKNPQIHTGAYGMIIPLLIIEGLGLTSIIEWSKKNKRSLKFSLRSNYSLLKIFFFLIFLLSLWEISHMLHQIHFHLLK